MATGEMWSDSPSHHSHHYQIRPERSGGHSYGENDFAMPGFLQKGSEGNFSFKNVTFRSIVQLSQ